MISGTMGITGDNSSTDSTKKESIIITGLDETYQYHNGWHQSNHEDAKGHNHMKYRGC